MVGTIDLGGAPEQAVTDGKGHLYVDLEDKDSIAAVDAKTLTVTATYSLAGKCGGPGGLAFDVKNHILFAACHDPQVMTILSSEDGKIITTLPIGNGTDGATFNPKTMEAFSSQRDGTLTVIKENSPTDFVVEQNVQTMTGTKTLTLDSKTSHIVLIAAEFGPTPAPPPGGGRGGRAPMLPDTFTILRWENRGGNTRERTRGIALGNDRRNSAVLKYIKSEECQSRQRQSSGGRTSKRHSGEWRSRERPGAGSSTTFPLDPTFHTRGTAACRRFPLVASSPESRTLARTSYCHGKQSLSRRAMRLFLS